jgi:hypothetical protein
MTDGQGLTAGGSNFDIISWPPILTFDITKIVSGSPLHLFLGEESHRDAIGF